MREKEDNGFGFENAVEATTVAHAVVKGWGPMPERASSCVT